MALRLLIILAGVAAAVFQTSFLSALAHPLSGIDPRLMLVVALVTAFRFREAAFAAIVSGIAADALSPLPFGVNLLIGLGVAALATFLFTHVFTNHSLPGVLGVNACAYLVSAGATAAAGLLVAAFSTGLPADIAGAEVAVALGTGLAVHLTATIIFLFAVKRALRWFTASFLVR